MSGMFTRFSYEEIRDTAPSLPAQHALARGDEMAQALCLALASLERIAGADSPEGGSPEVDALRALGRIKARLEPGA